MRPSHWQLVVICMGAFGVATAWFLAEQQQSINRPLKIDEQSFFFVVEPGATLPQVASNLAQRGILQQPHYLVWFARWKGRAARIQAGEYAIPRGTTPAQLLNRLVAGNVVQRSLTLVEGWTFAEVMDAVSSHPHIAHTLDGLGKDEIMLRLGLPGIHPEGRFFPDTYYFSSGAGDVALLKRAYQTMQERLEREWLARAPDLPLKTPAEALTLASIVEKETGQAEERPRIAGVFIRRLKKNMRLASDPTVIYGLGDAFDGNLRKKDLRRETPYNTYVRKGLPPTPIAMPGAQSIRAVLQPEAGDALFFVAKGDGSHHFSSSYQEHRQAVIRYQLGGRTGPRETKTGG